MAMVCLTRQVLQDQALGHGTVEVHMAVTQQAVAPHIHRLGNGGPLEDQTDQVVYHLRQQIHHVRFMELQTGPCVQPTKLGCRLYLVYTKTHMVLRPQRQVHPATSLKELVFLGINPNWLDYKKARSFDDAGFFNVWI